MPTIVDVITATIVNCFDRQRIVHALMKFGKPNPVATTDAN